MAVLQNSSAIKLAAIFITITLLSLLNLNPAIHNTIINIDTLVALKLNSIIGINPIFDQAVAWINTRIGDACVLLCICTVFVIHALRANNINETTRHLSFWAWIGILCIVTYLIECASEFFIKRDTPILALHQLKNLQAMYGITLHTCPTSSFPSGHGFAYIFFAVMAWARYFRISIFLWCTALIMLTFRLVVGLHWLSDIIFGSVFMTVLLIACINYTPLKKTYVYVEYMISYAIKLLLSWQEKITDHQIPQHKHRIG